LKNPVTKHWAGGVAQNEYPEFKSQYCKKKKKKVSEVKGGMNTNLNEFKENINK
jgi:hypothetical protein